MTLPQWIKWAFQPWPKGRHPFHSFALARQAARDIGVEIDHDKFVVAMKEAGYRVVCKYGRALYFDCLDTNEKHQFYRHKYIACDDRAQHPLDLRQYPGALAPQ